MVKITPLTSEDKKQMDHGGSINKITRVDRDLQVETFKSFLEKEKNIKEDLKNIESTILQESLSEYFFTLRVSPKENLHCKL